MQVAVQFFSQLREIVGLPQITIELAKNATVAGLLRELYARFPELKKWDRNILVGVGVEFVDRGYLIQPNDQIAIMPPVQGG